MKLRYVTAVLSALLPTAWCGTATAAPISYAYYSLLNPQYVTLSDPLHGFNEAALAGQITLHGGNVPGGLIDVFCIDIPDTLKQPGTFPAAGTLAGSFGSMVNALISHVRPMLGTVQDASAALQIAIWKVEYGSTLTVTTPNAPGVVSLADTYVAKVIGSNPAWSANPNFRVSTYLGLGNNQDQAFLTAVPEPASLLLLTAGLGMAGLARRSRRASTENAVSVVPAP